MYLSKHTITVITSLPKGVGEGSMLLVEATIAVEVAIGMDGSIIVVIWGKAVVVGVEEVAGVIVTEGVTIKIKPYINKYSCTQSLLDTMLNFCSRTTNIDHLNY